MFWIFGFCYRKKYIYISIENKIISFNVFYKVKNRILRPNEINSVLAEGEKIDDDLERQFSLLDIGCENAEKIVELHEKYKKQIPTEIKIIYDVLDNHVLANYRYDTVYSDNDDKINEDVFDEWVEEVKAKEEI